MRRQPAPALILMGLAATLTGCQTPPSNMTLQRGSQLLAAGSPGSAIPLLSQTVVAVPDGPEPVALLSLAYALDQQPERAVGQAALVRRDAADPPGWELVAVGISQMVSRRPDLATNILGRVVACSSSDSPMGQASRQWLALALALKGEPDKAVETLQNLAECSFMQVTAMSWAVLIHSRSGQAEPSAQALSRCAAVIATRAQPVPAGELTGQALYDSAVAMVAAGNLETAQARFTSLREKGGDTADVPVWLALITAARGDWPTARTMLKDACTTGARPSRGLASELFSVVFAMEDRPDAMIKYMLAGQRLLGRHSTPSYSVEQPTPEPVWFSDSMK